MNSTLIAIPPQDLIIFLFLFLRTLIFLFLFPLFAVNFFPTKIKILFSIALSLAFTPFFSGKLNLPTSIHLLIPLIFVDFLIFFIVSYFYRLILGGLQLGGEVAGLQMGFGISQTFDPASGVAMPIIAQFLYLIFLLLFFTFDIHHYLIYFLIKSSFQVTIGEFTFGRELFEYLLKRGSLIFEVAIKMFSAVLVFLFLINIILAVIGRLLPQINVLFVSFPLTVGLGLFIFGVSLIFIPRIFTSYNKEFLKLLSFFLKS